jgi:hypothetical protein
MQLDMCINLCMMELEMWMNLCMEPVMELDRYKSVGVSTPGVPGPTSKLSPRVPAQMGRRETEHEGGKKQAKGETCGLRVALRPSRVRLQ